MDNWRSFITLLHTLYTGTETFIMHLCGVGYDYLRTGQSYGLMGKKKSAGSFHNFPATSVLDGSSGGQVNRRDIVDWSIVYLEAILHILVCNYHYLAQPS
jgi:hypothetical protein